MKSKFKKYKTLVCSLFGLALATVPITAFAISCSTTSSSDNDNNNGWSDTPGDSNNEGTTVEHFSLDGFNSGERTEIGVGVTLTTDEDLNAWKTKKIKWFDLDGSRIKYTFIFNIKEYIMAFRNGRLPPVDFGSFTFRLEVFAQDGQTQESLDKVEDNNFWPDEIGVKWLQKTSIKYGRDTINLYLSDNIDEIPAYYHVIGDKHIINILSAEILGGKISIGDISNKYNGYYYYEEFEKNFREQFKPYTTDGWPNPKRLKINMGDHINGNTSRITYQYSIKESKF